MVQIKVSGFFAAMVGSIAGEIDGFQFVLWWVLNCVFRCWLLVESFKVKLVKNFVDE